MPMTKEAIEKIESMAKANTFEIDNATYTDKKLIQVRPEPLPDPKVLYINTLSGLVDYIKSDLDDESKHIVHIYDYNNVNVLGEYEPLFGRRKHYVNALFNDFSFNFNSFYNQEMFVINLQTQFKQTDKLLEVIQYAGNVLDSATVNNKDDGFSQETTIKNGIVNLEKVTIPNPVNLSPKRTFPEIEQPESQFVLRMKQGGSFALFEASGGHWRVDCIHKIKEHLKEELKETNCIIIA